MLPARVIEALSAGPVFGANTGAAGNAARVNPEQTTSAFHTTHGATGIEQRVKRELRPGDAGALKINFDDICSFLF